MKIKPFNQDGNDYIKIELGNETILYRYKDGKTDDVALLIHQILAQTAKIDKKRANNWKDFYYQIKKRMNKIKLIVNILINC